MQRTIEPGDAAIGLQMQELDELVMRLKRSDREAIVLRFYEGKSYVEMALGLGVGEDAARSICRPWWPMSIRTCAFPATNCSGQRSQ